MHKCKQKQSKILEIEHAGHKSKSGWQVFHVRYIISFVCSTNMSKHCKNHCNKPYFTECMDGLFHKITEWCIKYGVITTTEKTASIFQTMYTCCVLISELVKIRIKTVLKFCFMGVYL